MNHSANYLNLIFKIKKKNHHQKPPLLLPSFKLTTNLKNYDVTNYLLLSCPVSSRRFSKSQKINPMIIVSSLVSIPVFDDGITETRTKYFKIVYSDFFSFFDKPFKSSCLKRKACSVLSFGENKTLVKTS